MTDWLLRPARAERLALVRILVAGYGVVWLIVRFPHLVDVADFASSRWRPVGVLAPFDQPPAAGLMLLLAAVAVGAGTAVLLGWRHRVTGPVFAVALLVVTTWRTSWGQIFHTENLLVLHVLVLALVPAAAAWSLDARRLGPPAKAEGRFGWPVRVMALATVAAYFVAGVAKLRYGGWAWLDGDVLAHQVAYDNLRKAAVGSVTSPLAGPMLGASWLFTPMAFGSLAVELGAPLALLSARWSRWWAAAAWVFHLGIVVIMVIVFAYPLSGVALVPVLLAHGTDVPLPGVRRTLRDAWTTRRSRRRGRSSPERAPSPS
ncbi:MAG: HTTM domain-containing protein [Actinomycetota bacterium]